MPSGAFDKERSAYLAYKLKMSISDYLSKVYGEVLLQKSVGSCRHDLDVRIAIAAALFSST